ncbi:MAG: LysM peptidoglycan-binding domain-containing protein [Acidimicrobiales bacterium]|jgi:LysM repeat protein|nr:LysM peptidoglycan-binding domain-containing protein [Acidimicrobiales bacterium]MDP6910698.1 LysM peptidoglycan-binding domain-containing protein [Acidimicrobiales bacterium]
MGFPFRVAAPTGGIGLLLVVAVSACGGGGGGAAPPATTVGELFAGSATTTTVGGLSVAGWTHRDLPEMRTALDACVASVDVRGASTDEEEGPRTVTVESGDSLGKIAARFDRTVDQFMRANGISDPNRLQVGQILVVPAQRLETEPEYDGPTVLLEPVYCEVDTGVPAFGPDGAQIGGPGIIEVFADWKRLEGPDEAPRVNGRIRGLVQASVGGFAEDVANEVERHGFACRDGSHGRCAWLQHRQEVLLATDELFSVRDVVRRLMPGASAVEEEIRTETFDLETGRPITVAELFDPMTDWVAAVSVEAISRLAREPWTDERRVVGASSESGNFERFNLTHGGLVLSFAPGSIGGHGSNTVSITIPYRSLDGFWAEDGPVSRIE